MLAYYVQWHMQKRLEELFKKNKKGWERRWTFAQVIETLKMITRNRIEVNVMGYLFIETLSLTKSKNIF